MTIGSEFFSQFFVPLLAGLAGGFVTYKIQEQKLKKEHQLHDTAGQVARALLSHKSWRLRSFKVIRSHLGGFEDDELRRVLVRAGAIRYKAKHGEELWGLVKRNSDRLGMTKIDSDPHNLHDDDLFLHQVAPSKPGVGNRAA